MAKKAKTAKAKKATATMIPSFQEGSHVRDQSLVVDMNGVAWWVDPHACTITRAIAK